MFVLLKVNMSFWETLTIAQVRVCCTRFYTVLLAKSKLFETLVSLRILKYVQIFINPIND